MVFVVDWSFTQLNNCNAEATFAKRSPMMPIEPTDQETIAFKLTQKVIGGGTCLNFPLLVVVVVAAIVCT